MNLNDDQRTRLKNADYIIEDPLVFVDLLVDMMFIVDIIIAFRFALAYFLSISRMSVLVFYITLACLIYFCDYSCYE